MDHLGNFLFDQADYGQAAKLGRHVLDIRKRILGAEHPDILSAMRNLASDLQAQAEYHEAELLYCEVICLTKKMEAEGSDLLLLRTTNNYVGLLLDQNRHDEVERLIQSILLQVEKSLKNHEEILRCRSLLAGNFRGQRRYDEAEALNREVLQVQKSALGEEHSDTLATMNNLALVLASRDKNEEAEILYQDCLFGREKVHGQRHPITLLTVHNLGHLYLKNENLIDGEAFLRRAFEGRQVVLGSNHPNTLNSPLELGVVHCKKGDFIAAEGIFRSLVPRYESVFGLNHWKTTNCIGELVNTLLAVGNKQEAQEVLQEHNQRVHKREEEVETKAKVAAPGEIENEELVAEDSGQESSSGSWVTVDS